MSTSLINGGVKYMKRFIASLVLAIALLMVGSVVTVTQSTNMVGVAHAEAGGGD